MEIIQEIIGTRKKQQILNQEAKKTLHKQIKKVTNQREVSEPPPQLKNGFNSQPPQTMQPRQTDPRNDSVENQPVHGSITHTSSQHLSSSKHESSHRQTATKSSLQQDNCDVTTEQQHKPTSSSRINQQVSSPKVQSGQKKQQVSERQQQISASAQKKMQDMRVRKVRSKSPPTNESGKNPAAKIKKFYESMLPAFTNKKRQHAYYNTSKQGFTYINWDMENELYIFQTQIEQKFRKSAMNKNFQFPRIDPKQHNRESSEGSKQQTQLKSQRLSLHVSRPMLTESSQQPQKNQQRSSKISGHDIKKAQSVEKQRNPRGQDEGDQQRPQLLNANQNPSIASGELSARVSSSKNTSSFTNQLIKPTSNSRHPEQQPLQQPKGRNNHVSSSSAHKTPQSIISLKVQPASHPMSKSVLKPEKEQQDNSVPSLNPQAKYSLQPHKKQDKPSRDKASAGQTQSANSLKLTQQKQLSAMVKQTGMTQAHSSLFSPQGASRKNPKQMIQTTYVSMKGAGSSSKTYGLALAASTQSQTGPTTPLPITTNQNHMNGGLNYQSTRDQSARSQRDVQQQQGQSEPLLKKTNGYMARKNGQQHSVDQRMPKAAPAYCATQFNNSVNSSQMPSRLTVQTSTDGKELSHSAQKQIYGGVTDFNNMSQYTSTQRLNDSASGIHNSITNVIKFSSEYGTYNTVQIGEEMVNRSSDYGGGRADSTDRQSQSQTKIPMALSGIVSPDIQIQSSEQELLGFEPHRLLSQRNKNENTTKTQQPLRTGTAYGGNLNAPETHQTNKMTRSNQSSVQALRNTYSNDGQVSVRLSPQAKKRNIRGQMSSQMNKTTSQSEVKKLMMKTQSNLNSTGTMKAKSFYKTMIKPGTISSQSFVQVPDALVKTTTNLGHARFNSQTPRAITSPESTQNNLQKLQKTGDSKLETQYSSRAHVMTVTPTNKIKGGSNKGQRQQSLNSKEIFQVSKFRTDSNVGPSVNQQTPHAQKMAPSKAFVSTNSKNGKDNVTPNAKQKAVRSRNNESGKQTIDHNTNKNAKWVDEKQLKTATQKTAGLDKISAKQGKSTNQSKHQQQKRRDTEECENFDMKDLDEREPCQTFQSNEFHSTYSGQKSTMKVPLTTRSTHSLAINNLKKQMTQDLNLTSPGQHEESTSNKFSYQRQTQKQTVKYRNEHIKLQGPIAQPLSINTFQNLNPEYLSGDGSPKERHQHTNSILHTANGSASTSDLGKKQTQTIKDFFLEDQFVIKEEKHKGQKKTQGHTQGGKQNTRSKNGQLSLMARDFTMQNYSTKNGSTKVLNLPPKPSRNAKNNTLVLGNSTGVPTRSMQSILLSKVKNFNQQQTMQSTVVMTPKRDQIVTNNLFKGYQPRKNDSSKQTAAGTSHVATKSTSFKEPKLSQMRYFNKTAEKQNLNRGSIGDHGSPQQKRIDSSKKVNKVSSQELLKGHSGHQNQYSNSLLHGGHTLPSGAEKKGAKHLYMSLNKEKAGKSNSHREKSVSSDNHYLKQTSTGGKVREKNGVANQKKPRGGHEYEIVFDHMNEDSLPENLSYDMEEQPTVVLVEEMHPHEVIGQNRNGVHKSKERNASLLNSSALSREHQIGHPFSKSIEPVQHGVGRKMMKETRTAALNAELPKLGSADSKLFRQSIGVVQDGSSTQGLSGPGSIHENQGYNQQLAKKQNAFKMKQGSSNNTLFMGQNASQVMAQSQMQHPMLNKSQSLVSSQASLHQMPSQSTIQPQKQKLVKPGWSVTSHQKMLESYAKAMQESQTAQLERAGTGPHHSQKKTTKKSMIKQ